MGLVRKQSGFQVIHPCKKKKLKCCMYYMQTNYNIRFQFKKKIIFSKLIDIELLVILIHFLDAYLFILTNTFVNKLNKLIN